MMARNEKTVWNRFSKIYDRFIKKDEAAYREVIERVALLLKPEDSVLEIATGTGIAPFYSMFQSGQFENKKLIHGARYLNQFYFEDELDWTMGHNYVRCCSQEESCDVFPGRVTDYLNTLENLPKNQQYYLCGKALMVVEVRDLLIGRGIPYENILAEIYF